MKNFAIKLTLVLLAISANLYSADYIYLLTQNEYEHSSINYGIENEFGAYAEIADWENLKYDYPNNSASLIQAIAMRTGETAYINSNGQATNGAGLGYAAVQTSISTAGYSIIESTVDGNLSLSAISGMSKILVQVDIDNSLTIAKRLIFSGNLSALRKADIILGELISDSKYADDDQVKYLYSLSRSIQLLIADNGGTEGSVIELLRGYGVNITGNNLLPSDLDSYLTVGDDGQFHLPDLGSIFTHLSMVSDNAVTEIDNILTLLSSIKNDDTPFRMFVYPHETGMNRAIEIDYAEVALLRGMLYVFKALLITESAYDIYCGDEEDVATLMYSTTFSFQNDILDEFPSFLKLLPTENNSSDGAAILQEAKQMLLAGIYYIYYTIDIIAYETDDQSDDLIFISDMSQLENVTDILYTVYNSLADDYPAEIATETYYFYEITENNSSIGEMYLSFDPFSSISNSELYLEIDSNTAFLFEKEWVEIDHGYLSGCYSVSQVFSNDGMYSTNSMYYDNCYISGRISKNKDEIRNLTIECINLPEFYMAHAILDETDTDTFTFDLNPIFGGTDRYPDPLSLRDILPLFTKDNYPITGTVGYGLMQKGTDSDTAAQLGGILPDLSQNKWHSLGTVKGDEYYMMPVTDSIYQNHVYNWDPNTIIYDGSDYEYDEYTDDAYLVDYINFGTGVDGTNYGSIWLNKNYELEQINNLETTIYLTALNDTVSDGDIKIHIYGMPNYYNFVDIYRYYSDDEFDMGSWDYYDSGTAGSIIDSRVDFSFGNIGVSYIGKYLKADIALETEDSSLYFSQNINEHTRIVGSTPGNREMYSVEGILSYDNWQAGPVIIKACLDSRYPDDTTIASTILEDGPGEFVLEDIPANFNGYVYICVPNFNMSIDNIISDQELNLVEYVEGLSIGDSDLSGYDIIITSDNSTFSNAMNIAVDTEIEFSSMNDTGAAWYRFSPATDGVYEISFYSDASFEIYNNEGKLLYDLSSYMMGNEPLFGAKANEDYYIRTWGCEYDVLAFTIYWVDSLEANDLIDDAIEISSGTEYSGAINHATGMDLTDICCDDYIDIWYSFTPDSTGYYTFEKDNEEGAITLSIFDDNLNEALNEFKYCINNGSFYLQSGKEYYIRIATYWNGMSYAFTIYPPSNSALHNQTQAKAQNITEGETISGYINSNAKEKWYHFIPDSSGKYLVDTNNYEGDICIKVYDKFMTLENIDNDYYSNKSFYGIKDADYYVCVCSYYSDYFYFGNDEPINYDLLISKADTSLDNDHWLYATQIFIPDMVKGTTEGSTGGDLTEIVCNDNHDVWYKFTPYSDGFVCIDKQYSGDSFTFSVFANQYCNFTNLPDSLIYENRGCEDGAFIGVDAGITYYIRISMRDGETGMFEFFIDGISYSLEGDITLDGKVDITDLQTLADNWLYEDYSLYTSGDLNENGIVDIVDFSLLANNWNSQVILATSLLEDFETLPDRRFNWHSTGDAYWDQDSSESYNGQYSIRSGDIGNNQSSVITAELDTTKFNTISFAYKTSSEKGYDFLIFYINGVKKAEYSGLSQQWKTAQFSVPGGVTTFTWEYVKDGYVSSGQDCAWIDDVLLSDN